MNWKTAHIINQNAFSIGAGWEAKVLGLFAHLRSQKDKLTNMDRALLLQLLQEEIDKLALLENQALDSVVKLVYEYSLVETLEQYYDRPTCPSLALGYHTRWFKDKKNYAERIQTNIQGIKSELQGLIIGFQGDDPIVLMGLIYDILQKAENEFLRLYRTELEAAYSQGVRDAYLEKGCLYARIENDNPCDEICAEMVGDHEISLHGTLGIDLPPYHPNCQCVYLGIFGHD